VSRKGKAGPLEAGRGKYSPPASPERVTPEALKRRDNGFSLIGTFSERRRTSFFETSRERLEAREIDIPRKKFFRKNLDSESSIR
jgi:hypothetical protein